MCYQRAHFTLNICEHKCEYVNTTSVIFLKKTQDYHQNKKKWNTTTKKSGKKLGELWKRNFTDQRGTANYQQFHDCL